MTRRNGEIILFWRIVSCLTDIATTNTTSTDTTITKAETGLITGEDQINTNTIETNIKHRSFSNSQTKT